MKSNSQPSVLRPNRPAWAASLTAVCLSAACLVGGLIGCKKEQEKAVVLAQVGNSTLTLDELRESFPAEYEQLIRREQYLDFIKRWIDDEVIYQQAQKAKLETDPLVSRKLEKLRRKLLIEEFLSKENATEDFEPDELAMNQYYEMHKEDFRRKVPEVKFVHIRVQTNKQAAELKSKASRGDFLAVASANSLDAVPESYSSITFKKQTEFPPCLSQDIAGAGIGAVTLPVACPDGFYLVKVLERQDAGSLISFAEAKEEISGIMAMERKDKLLEGRIAKYKEGIPVSYNLDQIPGLAEPPKPAEAAPAEPVSPSGQPAAAAPTATPAAPATTAPMPKAAQTPIAPAQPAVDPRLPREPGQEPAAAMAKPKPFARKRVYKRPSDSADTRAAAPKPAAETTPETPGPKSDAEENPNAQTPAETP